MKKVLSALLALTMLFSLLVSSTTAWAAVSDARTVTADVPTMSGKVFAGWYHDEGLTDPYTSAPAQGATAYAKFVDEKVLDVHYQLSAGVNEDSAETGLRVITTVDSSNFSRVGFKVEYDARTGENAVVRSSNGVYKTIKGQDGKAILTYWPDEAFENDESLYFYAYNFKIKNAKFATTYTVTAFWETMDGTVVYGAPKEIVVNQAPSFNVLHISDADELAGFAETSQSKNYAGWTILLDVDINLNPGWTASSTAPDNTWSAPIGSTAKPFAGIFDGQGHTISGVYQSAAGTGLFKQTASTAVLKDFRLENSYFNTTGGNAGTVAGVLGGNAEKIYSNATLNRDGSGDQKFGGLFGKTTGTEVTISECWFEGKVYGKDHVGGIIGGAGATQTNINHCLFIGGNAGGWLQGNSHVAGICGWVDTGCHLDVYDSLSAASNSIQAGSPAGIVGSQGSANAFTIDHSVLIHQNAPYTRAGTYPSPTNCERYTREKTNWSEFYGSGGQTKMGAFLDFTDYWITRQGNIPALKSLAGFSVTTTEDDKTVYTIRNAADFKEFAATSQTMDFAGCIVRLAADIDMNPGWDAGYLTGSISSFNAALHAPDSVPANQWTTQIGSATYPFAGTFDGQGHTISGVYRSCSTNNGLFYKTAESCVLKDFRLENSYFANTGAYGGTIASDFAGRAEKIYSSAGFHKTSSGNSHFGGLFGRTVGNATLSECWFDGVVQTAGASYVGGIIGRLDSGTTTTEINHCLFSGIVNTSSGQQVSGFVGYASAGSLAIKDCASIGTFSASSNNNTGLFIGQSTIPSASIDEHCVCANNYSTYRAKGVGNTYAISDSSTAYNSKKSAQFAGMGSSVIMDKLDFTDYWSLRDGEVPAIRSLADDFTDAGIDVDRKTSYFIDNTSDLYMFAIVSQSKNFAGEAVYLNEDVTVNTGAVSASGMSGSPVAWQQIGSTSVPFAGKFDGNGHTVSGLFKRFTTQYGGMFTKTAPTAILRDFRLENSFFGTTVAYAGGIAGAFAGKAEKIYANVYVHKTTTGNSRFGGLFGAVAGGDATISECWFDGKVLTTGSSNYVGGLIGGMDSDAGEVNVNHCLFTGEITNVTSQAGGICGYMLAGNIYIRDTLSAGTIPASGSNGMLVGGRVSATPLIHFYNSVGVGSSTLQLGGNAGVQERVNCKRYTDQTAADFYGVGGMEFTTYLDFDKYWAIREGAVPGLQSLSDDYVADQVYAISSAAELNSFAAVSKTNNFAGWTITLANDIALNDGDASGWGASAPANAWAMIGTEAKPFAGTFDGQGHTVSGVYLSASTRSAGFFAATAESATVKNLSIANSYFTTSDNRFGSVAGTGRGLFCNVNSSAYVSGKAWTGGLIGYVSGNIALEHCRFDGTVADVTTANQGLGGIIGTVYSGTAVIRNCLNSGTVDVTACTNTKPAAGGLVGITGDNSTAPTLLIESSLNTGSIVKTAAQNDYYGRVLGYRKSGYVSVVGTYATEESCDGGEVRNGMPESVTLVSAIAVNGAAAQTNLPLLDWTNGWVTTETIPVPKNTEDGVGETIFTASAVTDADTTLLSTVYAGTTLYQGDMHAHADDDGRINETSALNAWKTEMGGHDLDFVASLDHRQTNHIENSEWDKDLFLYGTEPGTYISSLTSPTYSATKGKAHYLMLFKDRDSLLNVLQNGAFAFSYNSGKDNSSATPASGAYTYAEFTKSEFTALANAVKAQGGLFVFAHPYAYDYSGATEDYFIADGTGFEVVYGSLSLKQTEANGAVSDSYTKENLDTWKALLANGHKVWATAGSDIHGGMDTQDDHATNPQKAEKAIISVYAATSGDYLANRVMDRLTVGNFSAGSVGIQMCVNSTAMGGTTDFAGQRLVIKVGEFHQYVDHDGHYYRVDVISDQGIVYSRLVTNTECNSTGVTIALDADENARFYRVEVVSLSEGRTISYGNPIWNN